MTFVFFRPAPGSVVPEHSQLHEQIGTVIKGSVELNITGEKRVVSAGGAYPIPGDVVHSGITQGVPAEAIEVFSLAREDLTRG